MRPKIQLQDCLWVCGRNVATQTVFQSTQRAFAQRGYKVWKLDVHSEENLRQFRERVWNGDEHVIFQEPLAEELNRLRPIFERRKNFSLLPVDWWNVPFWFSRHATYLIFHNYNAVMVRTKQARFVDGTPPPLLLVPENFKLRFHVQSALLRPAALLAAPLLEILKWRQRAGDTVDPERLLYFPFPLTAEDVPLKSEPPQYDFTNMGATMGPFLIRDAYASAWLNLANLYRDRQRLLELMLQFEGQPFTVFDRRRNYTFLPYEELNRIVRQSRFMVCTGGLHQNSVPKFLEYACLGVPMIGTLLPFEYPWLDDCLLPVDAMNISAAELKPKLAEALELQPKLRANCLAWRDRLLKMYHPDALLDLLQAQMDGQPIPPGYLKIPARTSAG